MKKFHTYLYGRSFTLITDHKPLLGLFKEQQAIPAHASARIQRWALTLASYEYKLQFRKSTAHSNADALSRLPLTTAPVTVPEPPEIVLLMDHLDSSPVSATEIKRETSHNPLLSRLVYYNLYYMVGQIHAMAMNSSHTGQGGWNCQHRKVVCCGEIESLYPLHYAKEYCYSYMTRTWGYHV